MHEIWQFCRKYCVTDSVCFVIYMAYESKLDSIQMLQYTIVYSLSLCGFTAKMVLHTILLIPHR